MSSYDRRAAARRKAWGRGPHILRFEPLEGRQMLAASVVGPAADIVSTQFNTIHSAYWGDLFHASGTVANIGTATTTAPVPVEIYASTAPILGTPGASATLLGTATIPPGLQPGQSFAYDQIVGLPPTNAAMVPAGQSIYITTWVNPRLAVPESNTADNSGRGLGLDTSLVTIAQHQPANLAGTALSVVPTRTATAGVLTWGDSFNVVQQVKNKGEGDAPATRSRVVLTPAGQAPGGPGDVTIASIAVPPIPAFQTTNVVQGVTLPAVEPASLNGASNFTISVVQDADFLTQPIYPRLADQGAGLDSGTIGIAPTPPGTTRPNNLPDLAPATVVVSASTLHWGQGFQVGAVVQNVGLADAGPFTVRFVVTGVTGDLSKGVFLGDAVVAGLAANSSANVLANVQLPAKLPYGTNLASPAYSRIYAIVDPDGLIDQPTRTNNMASSAPVLLSVVGVNGETTVPTYPATIYGTTASATKAANSAKGSKTSKPVLGNATPAGKIKQQPKKKKDFLASASDAVTSSAEDGAKSLVSGVKSLLGRIGVIDQPAPKPTRAQLAAKAAREAKAANFAAAAKATKAAKVAAKVAATPKVVATT